MVEKIKIIDVVFTKITSIRSNDFKAAMDLYDKSFSYELKQDVDFIKRNVSNGSYDLYVGILNKKVVLFALLWDIKGTRYSYFEYLVISSSYRRKGIGTQFLEFIKFEKKGMNFIFEVLERKTSTFEFFRKNGAQVLKQVTCEDFINKTQKSYFNILVINRHKKESISKKLVQHLIDCIKKQVYYFDQYDINHFDLYLEKIPDSIQLITN